MTVNITTTRIAYTCNGILTEFTFPFKILVATDILAIRAVTESGLETVLTKDIDYTIAISPTSDGGTLTLTAGSVCPDGTTLTILRDIPITQETDFVEGGGFSSESIESALDKNTIITQQFDEVLDRSVKFPRSASSVISSQISAADFAGRAQKILGFNVLGSLALLPQTVAAARLASGSYIDVEDYDNDLTALITAIGGVATDVLIDGPAITSGNTTIPNTVRLLITVKGRINQGSYTLTINGPFSAPISRVFTGTGSVSFGAGAVTGGIYPEWWGAAGDGATDDSTEIQAAIDAAEAGTVFLAAKTYLIQSAIALSTGVTLQGVGKSASSVGNGTVILTNIAEAAISIPAGVYNTKLSDFILSGGTLTVGRNGISIQGTAGSNIYGCFMDCISFYRLDNAVQIGNYTATTVDAQNSQVVISNSKSDECNVAAIIDSYNSELRVEHSYLNFLEKGVYVKRAGLVTLSSVFGGAVGGSAGSTFVYAVQHGMLMLSACQAESVDYYVYVPASAPGDLAACIKLDNNKVDAPVSILSSRRFTSIGNTYDGGNVTLTDIYGASINDHFVSPYVLVVNAGYFSATSGQQSIVHVTPGADLASGATITPTSSIHKVSGTSAIATITPFWPGFSGQITLIPIAAFTTTTAGNIAIASTAVVGKALIMTYNHNDTKWYPSY